eukprot:6174818-Pleurochrysis_carterae.AAC.1
MESSRVFSNGLVRVMSTSRNMVENSRIVLRVLTGRGWRPRFDQLVASSPATYDCIDAVHIDFSTCGTYMHDIECAKALRARVGLAGAAAGARGGHNSLPSPYRPGGASLIESTLTRTGIEMPLSTGSERQFTADV